MKILQITSVIKPYRCGIGDYTWLLTKVLSENKSIEIKILAKTTEPQTSVISINKWSFLNFFKVWPLVKSFSPDIVHIQYPGKGLGYFLVLPFLTLLFRLKGFKIVLTLHEYEISHIIRKLSSLWLCFLSSYLILTNEYEKEKIQGLLSKIGFRKKEFWVIGLAPNIFNKGKIPKKIPAKIKKIATFGLFYPGRKMEEVINIFERLDSELEFYIVGSCDIVHISYFDKIKAMVDNVCRYKKIKLVLNKDEEFLENFFKEMDIFVLLYADGVSFKRTSLISPMSFGIPVVSNYGKATPVELIDEENIMIGKDNNEIVEKIKKLINSPDLYSKISENSYNLSKKFSWSEISAKHIMVYNSIIKNA